MSPATFCHPLFLRRESLADLKGPLSSLLKQKNDLLIRKTKNLYTLGLDILVTAIIFSFSASIVAFTHSHYLIGTIYLILLIASCLIALFLFKALKLLQISHSPLQITLLTTKEAQNANPVLRKVQKAHIKLLATLLEKEKQLQEIEKNEQKLLQQIAAESTSFYGIKSLL